jgi:hypothetical protein
MKNSNLPEVINFDYEGNPVSFAMDGKVMVNATQMAKPFGKRPSKWLELPSTKEFLDVLSNVRKSDTENLVVKQNGGRNPGTWMHEDAALEFARWLSPKFSIWCNDRIKELLAKEQPQTELPPSESVTNQKELVNEAVLENCRLFGKWFADFTDFLQKRLNPHCSFPPFNILKFD